MDREVGKEGGASFQGVPDCKALIPRWEPHPQPPKGATSKYLQMCTWGSQGLAYWMWDAYKLWLQHPCWWSPDPSSSWMEKVWGSRGCWLGRLSWEWAGMFEWTSAKWLQLSLTLCVGWVLYQIRDLLPPCCEVANMRACSSAHINWLHFNENVQNYITPWASLHATSLKHCTMPASKKDDHTNSWEY